MAAGVTKPESGLHRYFIWVCPECGHQVGTPDHSVNWCHTHQRRGESVGVVEAAAHDELRALTREAFRAVMGDAFDVKAIDRLAALFDEEEDDDGQ